MKKKSFQLHLAGIGLVSFCSSLRARRLSISVIPFQGVRVSVPIGMSLSKVEQSVRTRKTWIAKHLEQARKIEKQCQVLLRQVGTVDPVEARESLVS
ncbi:MAG: hypothetical protein DRH04_10590, partial [Deltaproteobacteria bacterium]